MEILIKDKDKYYHRVKTSDGMTYQKCALKECATRDCKISTYFEETKIKPSKNDIGKVLKLMKKVSKAKLKNKELVEYILNHREDETEGAT